MLEFDLDRLKEKSRKRNRCIRDLSLLTFLTCTTLCFGSGITSCNFYDQARKANYSGEVELRLKVADEQKEIAKTNGLLALGIVMGYLGYSYGKRKRYK